MITWNRLSTWLENVQHQWLHKSVKQYSNSGAVTGFTLLILTTEIHPSPLDITADYCISKSNGSSLALPFQQLSLPCLLLFQEITGDPCSQLRCLCCIYFYDFRFLSIVRFQHQALQLELFFIFLMNINSIHSCTSHTLNIVITFTVNDWILWIWILTTTLRY